MMVHVNLDRTRPWRPIGSLLVATVAGCAQDLRSTGAAQDGLNPVGAGEVALDVREHDAFVYYDLDLGEVVDPEEPADDGVWDLAASRYRIRLNGGSSGSEGVSAARLVEVEYAEFEVAPADGYRVDQADGDDEDMDPDLAFLVDGGWYEYHADDHTLSPQPVVYVVHSTEDRYYKLEFLGYYDAAGDSGELRFRFAEIRPPQSPGEP